MSLTIGGGAQRRLRWVLALLLGVGGPTAAGAHPHVFIEHAVTVVVGAAGVEAVRLTWTFDDMMSGVLIGRFDTDRDGRLSPDEVKAIERSQVSNLKQYHYFVEIKVNGIAVPVESVEEFQARVTEGRLTYSFSLRVPAPRPPEGALEIVVDDPSFYTAFEMRARSPIEVRAPRSYRVDCKVVTDPTGRQPESVHCAYRKQGR